MKSTALAVLMLAVLPVVVFAAGDHAGRHGGHEGGHTDHDGGQAGGNGDHGAGHHMPAAAGGMHAGAIGRRGDPAGVRRTIEVKMHDTMRFTPDRIRVMAGETVRFFLRNTGDLPHEFVIGSLEGLREHAAMMRAHPDMKHAEPNMVSLGPGKLGGLVWQFAEPGTVHFACLVPGHFEAGMLGKIEVE